MLLLNSIQILIALAILKVHAAFYTNSTDNTTAASLQPSPASSVSTSTFHPNDNITTSSVTSIENSFSSQSHLQNSSTIPSNSSYQNNDAVTTFPLTSGRLNSSQSNYNATITSPPTLPYLTSYISTDYDRNTTVTVTECPNVRSIFAPHRLNPKNSTCCDYYNASGTNLAAFNDWITADDAAPSPDVGVKYGCCGDCTVRATMQLYYWKSAAEMIPCLSSYTVSGSLEMSNSTSYYTYTYTQTLSRVDPAIGCNGTNTVPYTTVINNFTLTSPTPAVGFTSFFAYNHCGEVFGTTNYITPISTDLSTWVGQTTVTYPPDPSIGSPGSTAVIDIYSKLSFDDYDSCIKDCNPILDPANAYGLYRAVQTCYPPVYGFRDPPVALVRETGLGDANPLKTPPPAPSPTPPAIRKPTTVADLDTESSGQAKDPGGAGVEAIVQSDPVPKPSYPPSPYHVPPNVSPAPSPVGPTPTAPAPAPGASPGASPGAATPAGAPIITIGSARFTPGSASQYSFPGQTLSPGGPPIVYSNQIVSLAPSAFFIVVGSSTQILQPNPAVQTPAVTIGPNLILNPDPSRPSNYVVGLQTLVPGAPAINIDGTLVSLDPLGTAVVVDGSTRYLPIAPSALTVGSDTATINAAGELVFGSQTLLPGADPIIIDGSSVSLDAAGTAVWVNGNLLPIALSTPGSLAATANAVIFGTKTLVPGGAAITVGGETISLNPAGTAIVVNGAKTEIVTPGGSPVTIDGTVLSLPIAVTTPVIQTSTYQPGLGQYILKGLGATRADGGTTRKESSASRKSTAEKIRGSSGTSSAPTGTVIPLSENKEPGKKPSLGTRSVKGGRCVIWEALVLVVGVVALCGM